LIQYEKDSVVIISVKQAKLLLIERANLNMYKALNDSMELQLYYASNLIKAQKGLVNSLMAEKQINKELKSVYVEMQQRLTLEIDGLKKELIKRKKLNYIIGGGAVLVTAGAIVGVILLK
jgi:hypothetical protein